MAQYVVQLYDDLSSDLDVARYAGFVTPDDDGRSEPPLGAGQFVIIECPSGRRFFGIINGPQRNINRNSLGPTDNTALNQLEGIASGAIKRKVAVNEVFLYEASLLKEIMGDDEEC